jgi:hypothetical protein
MVGGWVFGAVFSRQFPVLGSVFASMIVYGIICSFFCGGVAFAKEHFDSN